MQEHSVSARTRRLRAEARSDKSGDPLGGSLRRHQCEPKEFPVVYHVDSPAEALRTVHRIFPRSNMPTGACQICGVPAKGFEDYSLRLEYEHLGFCPTCLDTLFGFLRRRQYHRVPWRLSILYCVDRRFFHLGLSRDVSLGGIFLLTSIRLSAENDIGIVLPSGREDKSIRIACRIVRSAQDGVGVAFMESKYCT